MRSRPTSTARLTGAMLVAAGCFAVAAPASAQQSGPQSGATSGLRYLSWSGKPEQTVSAAATPTSGGSAQDGLRRYPGMIPRQTAASVSAPPQPMPASYAARPSRYSPTPSNRLTPASAWLNTAPAPAPYAEPPPAPMADQPAPQPTYLPEPPSSTAPRPMSRPMVAAFAQPTYAAPVSAPPVSAPPVLDPPAYAQPTYSQPAASPPVYTSAPVDAPSSAYAEAPVPSLAAPQPGFEAAFDPMAPRRDAPIFRMGRDAAPIQGSAQGSAQGAPQPGALSDGSSTPLPAASATPSPNAAPTAYAAAEPPREGPRYYSVHRAAGHQPDAMVMPQSVYLDTAPIDLAEPPETPVPARTVNGRAQNIVPNEDPSLP